MVRYVTPDFAPTRAGLPGGGISESNGEQKRMENTIEFSLKNVFTGKTKLLILWILRVI